MMARIRKAMEEKDQGFTLIELLVVMIIIGILAAIAVPVFLNQRTKAVDTSIKSDLKNVASNIETLAVDSQAYPATADITANAATSPKISVGGRDVAGGNVSVIRRDRLYRADGKLDSNVLNKDDFVASIDQLLTEIQDSLFIEADARLKANIKPVDDWATVESMFADSVKNPGWADVAWSKPTGAALDAIVERLKTLKLTIRNAPQGQTGHPGAPCIFSGEPAVERVLIGRSY